MSSPTGILNASGPMEAQRVQPVLMPYDLFTVICVKLKQVSDCLLENAKASAVLTNRLPIDDASSEPFVMLLNSMIAANEATDSIEKILRACLDEHDGKPMPEAAVAS